MVTAMNILLTGAFRNAFVSPSST